jgi:hypothetical protein
MEAIQRPKLLDRVRQTFVENNYSPVTSNLYIKWIKRYIIFHKKVHPSFLNEKHIAQFLNYLSVTLNLSNSTQRQAFAAINFLYSQVLTDGWIMRDNFVWVNKNKQKPKKVIEKILTKSDNSKLNVFLCHANEDKKTIRKLYKRLKKDGCQPWMDEEDLVGGQDWEMEIERAVEKSDIVLVCLSKKSITKAGFVQKEIKFALDIADRQPERSIFIVPLRLEECNLPERLKKWQAIESYKKDGYSRLKKALNRRAITGLN